MTSLVMKIDNADVCMKSHKALHASCLIRWESSKSPITFVSHFIFVLGNPQALICIIVLLVSVVSNVAFVLLCK